MTSDTIKISLRTTNPPGEKTFTYPEFREHVLQLIDKAQYASAASFAQQVARAFPHDTNSRLLAAQALIHDRRPQEAIELTDQLIALLDDPSIARLLKARIALQLNNSAEAKALLETVLKSNKTSAAYHCESGDIYSSMGELDKARHCFIRAIELDIRNVRSLLKLSELPKQDIPDDLLKRMEFLIQSKQLSPRDQVMAHFSMAYIYDNRGDIPMHFNHLNAGNKLASRTYNYDPEMDKNYNSAIIEFFSKEFFHQHLPFTQHQDNLIFIVGLPRCGSTLIEQILCAHPAVCGAGESAFLMNSIGHFSRKHANRAKFPNIISTSNYDKLPSLADDYLGLQAPLKDSEVVIDKTLDNRNYIGLISLIFPNAKFIHTKRHPVATLYGCYKRLFARGNITYSYNLDHLVAYYREYQRLMNHWENVLPGKIFNLNYESLIEDQENVTRELLEYCELSWNDRCLKFHENKGSVFTSSNAQVKQKLYSSAAYKWKDYAEYLGPLMELREAQQ